MIELESMRGVLGSGYSVSECFPDESIEDGEVLTDAERNARMHGKFFVLYNIT